MKFHYSIKSPRPIRPFWLIFFRKLIQNEKINLIGMVKSDKTPTNKESKPAKVQQVAGKNSASTSTNVRKSRKVTKVPTPEKFAFEEQLINFVEVNKQLWDSADEDYKDSTKTENNFKRFIEENSLKYSVDEVKQTWQSLRSSFNRKRKEIRDNGE